MAKKETKKKICKDWYIIKAVEGECPYCYEIFHIKSKYSEFTDGGTEVKCNGCGKTFILDSII